MRSKTSLINGTIVKKDIQRFWPLWVIELILLLLVGPLATGIQVIDYRLEQRRPEEMMRWSAEQIDFFIKQAFSTYMNNYIIIFHIAFAAIISAILVFDYLNIRTRAYMIHSMPVSRNTLFLSHASAGFIMVSVPFLFANIVLGVMNLAFGAGMGMAILGYALQSLLMVMFFFSLACLVTILSGHAFMSFVIFVVVNGLVVSVWYMFWYLAATYQVGGTFVTDDWFGLVKVLTPVGYYMDHMNVELYNTAQTIDTINATGLAWMCLYLIPSVVFIYLALYLYKKRPLENIGDNLAFNWCRPVFKIVFTVGGALLVMQVWQLIFERLITRCFSRNGCVIIVCITLAICCLIFYVIADMIVKKTFMVWKNISWITIAGVAAAMILVLLGLRAAYDKKSIPNPEDMTQAQVVIHGNEYTFDQKEIFEGINALHEETRNQAKAMIDYDNEWNDGEFYICCGYTLKDGQRMEKYYYLDSEACAQILDQADQLLNHKEILMDGMGLDHAEDYQVNAGHIFFLDDVVYFCNDWECKAIYEAILKDIEEDHVDFSASYHREEGKAPFCLVIDLVNKQAANSSYDAGHHECYFEITDVCVYTMDVIKEIIAAETH